MVDLYLDQQGFVQGLREALAAGHKSILGVASPAFGKTVVAGHIIQAAKQRGKSCVFSVHRKNLLRQTSKSFWAAGIEHGLITSGKATTPCSTQVATIGSLYSRRASAKLPDILFVDEAHLSRGEMFETMIKMVLDNGGIVIGLTGTPERFDGKPLGALFTVMVEARPPAWLISEGRLSEYEIYSTDTMPDYSDVRVQDGDLNKKDLEKVTDRPTITGDAIKHWRKYANGKKTVAYCVSVAHSKNTAASFNNAGIPSVHVDGTSTESEIKDACEGLASGRYLVLCNCELVIEGFDLSAQVGQDVTIECVILLRRTLSVSRYLQMIFRALRKKPDAAIILDHAGCALLHGLPDDDREWSLEGRKKSKRGKRDEADVNISQCRQCFHVFRSGPDSCPKCGAPVAQPVKPPLEVDGELVKIEAAAKRREQRQQQGAARTLAELVQLGVRRKLKHPTGWAANIYASREGRKPNANDYKEAKLALEDLQHDTAF